MTLQFNEMVAKSHWMKTRSSMVMGAVVNNLDLFGENGEIMPARFERRNSINNLRSSWPPVGNQHRTYNLGFSEAAYEAARYDFTHPNHMMRIWNDIPSTRR